jgi:beta-lactamase regulating signal transducer with metallopeptidase domain
MSDFFIILFKKIVYLNINLLLSVGLAFLIIKIGKIKKPEIKYVIWSFVILRFIFDVIFYPQNSVVYSEVLPPRGHGLLTLSIGISANLHKIMFSEFQFYNITRSAGDILASILGAEPTLYIGFFICTLGIYFLFKKLIQYYLFYREINKTFITSESFHFPNIKISDHIKTPLVLGIFKPVIVLPLSLTCIYTEEELRSVLSHEQAHIKRKDHIIFTLLLVLESFFIFVPPLRTAIKKLSEAEEQICDKMVVSNGERKKTIASALLKLAEFQSSIVDIKNNILRPVPGFIGENEILEERLANIYFVEKMTNSKLRQNLTQGILYIISFILIFGCSLF